MPHLNKPLSECADDAVSLLPSAVSSACTIGRIGAAAAALCAVTGFTGWVLGFELLKSLFIPGGITMKANTALGLLSAAASLWVVSTESILASHRRNIAWTLAAFTLLIGAVTLCEHAFGWDLGIDQLLFSEPPGAAATASPGRMGVPASSSFLLLGLALLSICRQTPRSDRISQYLALIVAVIAFLPLIGFAYGIEPLYGIARFTGIAPHTAVAIELLAIGILCARPRGDIMRVICADDTGGMMARRLMIPAILVPPILGFIRTIGEETGAFDYTIGRPMMVLVMSLGFGWLVWWNARALGVASRERATAELRRVSAEAASRESDRRMRLAMDAASQGYWEYAVDCQVTWVSAETAAILGLPPIEKDLSPAQWRQLIHPADIVPVNEHVKVVLATAREYDIEFRVVRPGGDVHWVALRGSIIRAPDGHPQRIVGVASDITSRKEAEEALRHAKETAERASNAKDQFLAFLSHELRTPLTPVLAIVQSLEADSSLASETRDLAAIVRRNVELEARLVDDLLDLTRISRGKLELRFSPVDARETIRQVLQICAGDISAKQLRLTTRLDAANHLVPADAPRLQQILWNIIKNAIKFTPAAGAITIETANADSRLLIRISDSGIGIDPRMLPRIFMAFEQGGPDTTRKFGGLGLGLTISRALTEMHGGCLDARSEGHGRGAVFTLTLPLSEQPATVDPAPDLNRNGGFLAGCRVLLVDDHPDTLFAMSRLLRSLTSYVKTASCVADALRVVETEPPFDLVISDLGLPDGTGHDLLRQILARCPVRAIALTGFGMEDDLKRSREAGFDAHLTKPINFEDLRTTIERVLTAQYTLETPCTAPV